LGLTAVLGLVAVSVPLPAPVALDPLLAALAVEALFSLSCICAAIQEATAGTDTEMLPVFALPAVDPEPVGIEQPPDAIAMSTEAQAIESDKRIGFILWYAIFLYLTMTDTLPLSADTVTEQTAVLPPSAVVTVIVAEPTATPVTRPDDETVAMLVSLDDQVTL
jgi:hypothetical protein